MYEVKSMRPWAVDASGVDISQLHEMPYCHRKLKYFFNDGIDGMERILVAPKGFGKTLFLKYKSHLVRQKYQKQLSIYPSDEQDIEFLKLSLSPEETRRDVGRLSRDDWPLIWQFALLAKAVQTTVDDPFDDAYLEGLLRRRSITISDILTEVIRDTGELAANISRRLESLYATFKAGGRDMVIFIDNCDEMLLGRVVSIVERTKEARANKDEPARDAAKDSSKEAARDAANEPASTSADEDGDTALAVEVARSNPKAWRLAQIGLAIAVREIERRAKRLRVFTTLRAEAVASMAEHPDLQQATTYTLNVKYSRDDLLAIFAWHVNMMDEVDLVDPTAECPAAKLMGKNPIPHRYVTKRGQYAAEDPFDLVLRHTRYSPRDLVQLGGSIAEIPIKERCSDHRATKIRGALDPGVRQLFGAFQQNSIPRWLPEHDAAMMSLPAAVLDGSMIAKMGRQNAEILYRFGLLGIAVPIAGMEDHYIQSFITPWDDAYGNALCPLPVADFYFVHPWAFDYAKNRPEGFVKDIRTIMGHECPYIRRSTLDIEVRTCPKGLLEAGFDGVFDSPFLGRTSSMPANFLFSAILACQQAGTSRLSKDMFLKGNAVFSERWQRFIGSGPSNPFEDSAHRSHLHSELVERFPNLRAKADPNKQLLMFEDVTVRGQRVAQFVTLTFLELESLKVEPLGAAA